MAHVIQQTVQGSGAALVVVITLSWRQTCPSRCIWLGGPQFHGPRLLLSGQVKVSWLEAIGEQVTCHNLLVRYQNSA